MKPPAWYAALFVIPLLCEPAAAAPSAGVLCAALEPDSIAVDGMLDDWEGLSGRSAGGRSSDASFTLRCGHDDDRLYLSVEISDERVLRVARQPSRRADDHLELAVRAGDGRAETVVVAFPGVDKTPPVRTWRGGKLPATVHAEDSLQPRGWAFEVSLPLAALPGWGPGTPALYYRAAYRDADLASEGKIQTSLGLEGRLVFAAAAAAYKAFLAQHKLAPADLKLDKILELDGAPGLERLLAGGRVIGVVTDGFSFVELPVAGAADVVTVRLVDATAAGKPAVLAHFRQHGNGGTRELVGVWTLSDGVFARTLAVEVAKQLGERSLRATWKLVARPAQPARGKGKRRTPAVPAGTDLVVEAGEAIGWDEDSYEETPATDVTPIVTPWAEQTRVVIPL